MKKIYLYSSIAVLVLTIGSCRKLDRFPLDSPSSTTFYSDKTEMDLAIAALYNPALYPQDSEEFTDNFWDRASIGNEIIHSTATNQSSNFLNLWTVSYKAIARANAILDNINKPQDVTAAYRAQTAAQARFVRAYMYYALVVKFGAVPLITTTETLQQGYTQTRTPVATIQKFVYDELDAAAAVLPTSYSTGLQYFTKGAALGIKARFALYMSDWATAADASSQVMALNVYKLYPSYRNLFLKAGDHSSEIMISFPRSAAYNVTYSIQDVMSRLAGGYAEYVPTLELIDSYECTDGKTIDKSPLYNYKKPFANRDPRLGATIVTPDSTFLGFVFENHPDSTLVFSVKANKKVTNTDNKNAANPFASYTGYLFKKTLDDSQLANYNAVDLDLIVMRYPEMLLTYAEAKLELGQIDQSVLNAVNTVRARAYGVALAATTSYPAVTTMDQAALRRIVRRERRIEFAYEGLRYEDLLRWKLAEKAFNTTIYGIPISKTDYPFPGTPTFDADDIPSYSALASKLSVIDHRSFNPAKNYLWAIPYNELVVDPALGQNPNW